MLHLITGGRRLRMGNEGVEASNALPPPQPTLNPSSKGRLCKHGLLIHSWVEIPELRGQAAAQNVVAKVPAREAPERDHGGNSDERRGRQVRRARFPYAPPPSAPSHPLSCHGMEAGVPRCGGSQPRQRGQQPELRGHAAAQVVAVKVPARGAPERDNGGKDTRAEGGKCDARASPMRRRPPSHPNPYPATAWRRGLPSCGGSQVHQRGEPPELRGQAAAQVVVVKGSAREAPERDHGGTWRWMQRAASATRALPLHAAALRALPPPTLPRFGGGGAEMRWLTGTPAR